MDYFINRYFQNLLESDGHGNQCQCGTLWWISPLYIPLLHTRNVNLENESVNLHNYCKSWEKFSLRLPSGLVWFNILAASVTSNNDSVHQHHRNDRSSDLFSNGGKDRHFHNNVDHRSCTEGGLYGKCCQYRLFCGAWLVLNEYSICAPM